LFGVHLFLLLEARRSKGLRAKGREQKTRSVYLTEMQTQQYQEAKKLNTERHQRAILGILQGLPRGVWTTDRRIAELMGQDADKFERTVRLIIRDLRRQGYPIASESGKGYRWPINIADVDRTIADLRSRASDLYTTARAMRRGVWEIFGGQERLPLDEEHKQLV